MIDVAVALIGTMPGSAIIFVVVVAVVVIVYSVFTSELKAFITMALNNMNTPMIS